ncbi:MAG: FAD-dependent oxidoreductase [Trebonia sp.]
MTQVAVLGGGVSGLNTARLLCAAGVSLELFEARDRLGGRTLTVDGTGAPSDDGYDLGPSWFWPRLQPAIGALADELGLGSFPQSSAAEARMPAVSSSDSRASGQGSRRRHFHPCGPRHLYPQIMTR